MWIDNVIPLFTTTGVVIGWFLPYYTGDEVDTYKTVLHVVREVALIFSLVVAWSTGWHVPVVAVTYAVFSFSKWRFVPTAAVALDPTAATGVFINLLATGSLEDFTVAELALGVFAFAVVGVTTALLL